MDDSIEPASVASMTSRPAPIFGGRDQTHEERRLRRATVAAPRNASLVATPTCTSPSRRTEAAAELSIYRDSTRALRLVDRGRDRFASHDVAPPASNELSEDSTKMSAKSNIELVKYVDRERGGGDREEGADESANAASTEDSEVANAVIDVLDAPALPGDTLRTHYERKESALVTVFATLTAMESQRIHRRLSAVESTDALAVRFSRLVIERRSRLLAFLALAPRREARASARIDQPKHSKQRQSPSKESES